MADLVGIRRLGIGTRLSPMEFEQRRHAHSSGLYRPAGSPRRLSRYLARTFALQGGWSSAQHGAGVAT